MICDSFRRADENQAIAVVMLKYIRHATKNLILCVIVLTMRRRLINLVMFLSNLAGVATLCGALTTPLDDGV